MTNSIDIVRRTANISREDALKGLIAKFPNHDILSLKEEIVTYASGDKTSESKNWVAEIQKKAEFPGAAVAEPGLDEEMPEAPVAPEDQLAEESDELDVLGDEEESEDAKLDEILDLLKELLGGPGEGAPHGDEGPTGAPVPVPGDNDLPSPVKPANSLGMDNPRPAFAHLANRINFVVEAEAPGQSLKAAVAELNAALPLTHRVSKIQRRGSKIIAGVTRIPTGV